MPALPAGVPEPEKAAAPEIEWKDGCGKELQSAIAGRLNDMIGTYVQRVTAIAIIGPNSLEFSLPINYDVERKALDRPETVARLEAIIAELVGMPIRVRFRTTDAVETATKPIQAAPTSQRNQVIEEPDDPFLQEITKTFGVQKWLVKELVVVESTENDPTEMGSE